MAMILCAAFSSDFVIARRTLRTSVKGISRLGGVGGLVGLLRTSLGPGLGESHVKRPLLPANVFVCLSEKVRLSPLLLEELDDNLTSSAWLVGAVYGAHKRKRLLLNKGFKVDIIDGGQRQVEQVACQGRYRGKVPVKEDGMQDCCRAVRTCSRGRAGHRTRR